MKTHSIAILLLSLPVSSNAATLISGYTQGASSQLLIANGGGALQTFADFGQTGGANNPSGTGSTLSTLVPGTWAIGDTVSVTGLAMALRGTTANGTFTFDIRQGSGGSGTTNSGGLNSLGTRNATFGSTGTTSAYYVTFDTPLSFVADAKTMSLVINWASTGNIDWKSEGNGGGRPLRVDYATGEVVSSQTVYFSLAGSVIPVVPEPSVAILGALGTLVFLRRKR